MNKSSDIKQELQAASPFLAELDLILPFEVPTGYFDRFPIQVLSALKAAEMIDETDAADGFSPVLNVDKSMPFAVPGNYFDNLAGDLLSKVRSKEETPDEELRNISLFMAGVPKSNPYFLEDGYFQALKLPVNIKDQPAKARVFVMGNWKRLAAAAVFAGIILTSVLFYFDQTMGDKIETATNGTSMKPLSEKALSDFLAIDNPEIMPAALADDNNSFALIDINENTIDEVLQTVGDNAIKEFMNENPGAVISDKLN